MMDLHATECKNFRTLSLDDRRMTGRHLGLAACPSAGEARRCASGGRVGRLSDHRLIEPRRTALCNFLQRDSGQASQRGHDWARRERRDPVFPRSGTVEGGLTLIRNQQVSGSSPLAGSIVFNNLAGPLVHCFRRWLRLGCVLVARRGDQQRPDCHFGSHADTEGWATIQWSVGSRGCAASHSRARRWASAIWVGVIRPATWSRTSTVLSRASPVVRKAERLNHMCACT